MTIWSKHRKRPIKREMSGNFFHIIWSAYKSASDQLQWSSVFVYGALFLASWLLYKLAVEPFISPLRKVPGMPYNPILGNMQALIKGEAMEATMKMIERCGPVFRYYMLFGRERLGLADPEVIRYIAITNSRNYIKPPSRIRLLKMILGSGLILIEGDVHTSHKRLLSPAFNNQAITKHIPVFEKRIRRLVEYWKKKIEQEQGGCRGDVDASADIGRTTLDIIGETAFGYEFDSLENPDHVVTTAFAKILEGRGLSYRFFIPFYFNLPFPDANRVRRELKLMRDAVCDIISRKRDLLLKTEEDSSEVTKDVLGMMMVARDETTGSGLTDEELRDEVMTLMMAGHETTAVTMSWCLLSLASNKSVQDKVRAEIAAQLRDDEPLTFESLEKLEYCGAVVKETLRLFPAVPITLRQALSADVLPGNVQVPAGTIMSLCIGPMMRRPEIYDDPLLFRPERFENKETESTFHNFLPFLIGPRMCLGYKYALVELRLMLALLIPHFEFGVIPGMEFKRKSAITMRPDPPLKLRITLLS